MSHTWPLINFEFNGYWLYCVCISRKNALTTEQIVNEIVNKKVKASQSWLKHLFFIGPEFQTTLVTISHSKYSFSNSYKWLPLILSVIADLRLLRSKLHLNWWCSGIFSLSHWVPWRCTLQWKTKLREWLHTFESNQLNLI